MKSSSITHWIKILAIDGSLVFGTVLTIQPLDISGSRGGGDTIHHAVRESDVP